MDKLEVYSVKAVMQTLNVSLSDLIDNDELISLLRERVLSGAISKDILHLITKTIAAKPEKSPETDVHATHKV